MAYVQLLSRKKYDSFSVTQNPKISNKQLIEKDKHHISWKNHGIDNYIAEALENYLKTR